MAQKIWLLTYNIRKINGEGYPVPQELLRIDEDSIDTEIRKAAKRISEAFDFPYVEVTAKATEDGTLRTCKFEQDAGYRDEWTVNPKKY